MADRPPPQSEQLPEARFHDEVSRRARRRRRHRAAGDRSIWFWLGMFGLVGWSVSVPTVIGLLIGVWADRRWPGRISWTLSGLVIGALIGCWMAWFWIKRESRGEREQNRDDVE